MKDLSGDQSSKSSSRDGLAKERKREEIGLSTPQSKAISDDQRDMLRVVIGNSFNLRSARTFNAIERQTRNKSPERSFTLGFQIYQAHLAKAKLRRRLNDD